MSLVTSSNSFWYKQYENANNANFRSFEKPLMNPYKHELSVAIVIFGIVITIDYCRW